MVLHSLYNMATEVLTFWMPVFYTFKFLMNKETTRIPNILKFWCMISCYKLISLLLQNILDDNIYPIINLGVLVALNWPPYEIAEKVYDSTLGPIFKQNRKSLETMEDSVVKIFDKNTEKLKNKMKDSTNDKMKGFVGDVLMATMNNANRNAQGKKKRKQRNSDSEEDSDENEN